MPASLAYVPDARMEPSNLSTINFSLAKMSCQFSSFFPACSEVHSDKDLPSLHIGSPYSSLFVTVDEEKQNLLYRIVERHREAVEHCCLVAADVARDGQSIDDILAATGTIVLNLTNAYEQRVSLASVMQLPVLYPTPTECHLVVIAMSILSSLMVQSGATRDQGTTSQAILGQIKFLRALSVAPSDSMAALSGKLDIL